MASFDDFVKPGAGKPAGPSFDDFVPEKPAAAAEAPGYGKRVLGAAASLGDFVLSAPAFVMGIGADTGARLAGTIAQPWSGESRREIAQGGLRAKERTMHLFGNPLQKLMAAMQGGAEAYEGSTPAALMQAFSKLVESGGERVERATGGGVLKEDFMSGTDLAMLAGPPAVGAAWKAAKGKPALPPASTRLDLLAERAAEQRPEILAQQVKTPEARLQDFLDRTLTAQAKLQGKARKGRQADLEAAFTQGRVEPEAAADPRNAGASATDIAGRLDAEIPMQEKAAAESRAAAAESWLTDQAKRRGLAVGGAGAAAAVLAASQDDAKDLAPGLAMFIPLAVKGNRVRAAEAMKAAGKTREEIWQNLGAWQGPDGKWRGEISDAGAKLREDKLPSALGGKRTLGEVLDHPELFSERPDLRDTPVIPEGFSFSRKGSYNPQTGEIALARGEPADVLSTLLHEVQHPIQQKSGLARGGSPSEFLPPRFRENLRELDSLIFEKAESLAKVAGEPVSVGALTDVAKLVAKGQNSFASPAYQTAHRLLQHPDAATLLDAARLRDSFDKAQANTHGQYRRLAGEAEARLVQARREMTPDERRATPPWKMFDVPEEKQIVKGQDEGQAAGLQAAVKEPGGMWHPEAAERLSRALKNSLIKEGETLHDEAAVDRIVRSQTAGGPEATALAQELFAKTPTGLREAWTNKAVQNWLNRYAGTARDPLKDIEIPYGQGTKRLEEVTDQAIGKAAEPERAGGRPGETVWDIEHADRGPIAEARQALQSFFAHMGDYAKQNIPLEKLPQYDLTRLARETAANDARVAREMERAAAASMKDLPVHKAYPDGFKWVELKLPEKLTPEQAKGVRPVTAEEWGDLHKWTDIRKAIKANPELYNEALRKGEVDYKAVDAQGKPITNSYTGEHVIAKTPQEAWLAGQLAREGNQMGHCVGGYCSDVTSGGSRIFSLRDPKGKPHVTVETKPADFSKWEGFDIDRVPIDPVTERPIWDELKKDPGFSEWAAAQVPDIAQIKGKAPGQRVTADYYPYVQDFVKGGKWGEVKDLENAGLTKAARLAESERETAKRLGVEKDYYTEADINALYEPVENVRNSGRPVTEEAVLAEIDRLRAARDQRGAADPRILGALAIGGGAALLAALNDEPVDSTGAAMAAGLFGLGMPKGRGGFKTARDYLGVVSTTLRDADPALLRHARQFEERLQTRKNEVKAAGDPFLASAESLPRAQKRALNRAVLTNDPAAVDAAIVATGRPALAQQWRNLRAGLDRLGQELQAAGIVPKLRTDYFPRIVKDVEGLFSEIGKTATTELQKRLLDADRKAVTSRGSGLTQLEESAIINQYLLEPLRQGHRPAWTKGRSVPEITEALEPYYLNMTDSFHAYANSAAMQLEKGKFFGKDAVYAKKGPGNYINTDASIGALVRRLFEEGRIDHGQMGELEQIFRARFGPGERQSSGAIQDFRNVSTGLLLGNPVSAAINVTDLGTTARIHGVWPTLVSVAKNLAPGGKHLELKDLGFVDHISEEFVSTRKSAKFLNGMMKWGGFSWVDRLMKETNLEAARGNYEKLAQTPEGVAQIGEKYANYFDKDFPRLIQDLRARRLTDLTRELYFGELSDIQPMTKLEVPLKYLEHPNGRLLYMFKSFMLKQLDQMRREGYNEIAAGNKVKGVQNLAKIAAVLGVSGASVEMLKDYLLGKPFDTEWEDIPMNTLKTFGFSEYVMDKARQGKLREAGAAMLAPPVSVFEDIIRGDPKAVRYIPVVGKLMSEEAWSEEGKRRAEEKKLKKDLRKVNREVGPMFGKPTELQREEIRDRRQMLRELRGH